MQLREACRDEQIKKALDPKPREEAPMSEEEKAEALGLLRDPRLIERVLGDFELCGVVGEETNKHVVFWRQSRGCWKSPWLWSCSPHPPRARVR